MTELGFFKHAAILLILTVAATGCNNEKPDSPEQNERMTVNLKADIKPSTLKVANDQWEENEKVGLFMKKAGQTITATGAVYSDAANVQMSISEQMLIAETPVLYPASGNVDFIAYYPYTETAENDYTIAVNVADQTEALPVELLYSNNAANQKPTEDPVMLNFQYSLAKLEVTVKGGANSAFTAADFAAMTASIEGMNTQANLNLADGAFTEKQAKETITLRKTGSTNVTATFEALVLPTTVADGEITFLFQVGNKTYPYFLTTNYTSGKLYDLHFVIDFTAMNEPKATLQNASILSRTKITENYVIDGNLMEETISLKETKWKLVGIVETETGSLKELEPKDCVECFTLSFDKGTFEGEEVDTFEGRAVEVVFYSSWYMADHTLSTMQLYNIQRPDNEDCYDGEIFLNAIFFDISELIINEEKTWSYQLIHFELKDSELKLYYHNNKNKYLLLKKI